MAAMAAMAGGSAQANGATETTESIFVLEEGAREREL
jgi:hypothetical protein